MNYVIDTMTKTFASIGAWKCNFSPFQELKTHRPTNKPTKQRTAMRVRREVILPIINLHRFALVEQRKTAKRTNDAVHAGGVTRGSETTSLGQRGKSSESIPSNQELYFVNMTIFCRKDADGSLLLLHIHFCHLILYLSIINAS